MYSDEDLRNPRGYRFEIFDGTAWRTIAEGVNPDTGGAAMNYELARAESARYLRYTMVDTFCLNGTCGANFVVSDVKAGLLGS